MKHGMDISGEIAATGKYAQAITRIFDALPLPVLGLFLLVLTMILFYATSFDSIAYTAACYSYRRLKEDEHPHKLIQFMWCILLIVLPVGLVFSESSMNNIQSVSIISAFPIGLIMIVMIWAFIKEMLSKG